MLLEDSAYIINDTDTLFGGKYVAGSKFNIALLTTRHGIDAIFVFTRESRKPKAPKYAKLGCCIDRSATQITGIPNAKGIGVKAARVENVDEHIKIGAQHATADFLAACFVIMKSFGAHIEDTDFTYVSVFEIRIHEATRFIKQRRVRDYSPIAWKVDNRLGSTPNGNGCRINRPIGRGLTLWRVRHCINVIVVCIRIGFVREWLAEFSNKPRYERDRVATCRYF